MESRKLRHEVARNVADDGHTVKQLRVLLHSTSATVARNNFKGGHKVQLSSFAQCCTVCSGLYGDFIQESTKNVPTSASNGSQNF